MTTLRMRLLAGTLLLSAAPTIAHAQDQKTPPVTGAITLLTRAYTDQPPPEDRAKYEQYGELPPGVFISTLDLALPFSASASAAFSGSNIGLNNQAYRLRAWDAGRAYLNLEFQETPHLFSTQALSLFDQVGASTLKVPDSVRSALEAATTNAARAGIINGNVHETRISLTRETSRANLRWTPGPSWDVRLDYSYEDRAGTMPLSGGLNGYNSVEFAAPVSTSTQNFGANIQYVGKLTDARRWTIALGYNGSLFTNNLTSITFDNPFQFRAPSGNNLSANQGQMSTAPSNEAHRLTMTGSADLPFNARYVGTASYSRMTQNEPFLPFTINSSIRSAAPINGLPTGTPMSDLGLLPARSLNGEIDETLINNQLTMRFGTRWTATLRQRHLDVDNNTPLLNFASYVLTDGIRIDTDRQNYRPAYRRDNASLDLNWRPALGWNAGATAGWERYDRDNRDVDVTDEYSEKLFLDARPKGMPWLQGRVSVQHSNREAENYNALANVGVIGFPPAGADSLTNPLMRKFDMADVERLRFDASADLIFKRGFSISPTGSWRHSQFDDNNADGGDLGLKDEEYWNAGVTLAMPLTRRLTTSLSYLREEYDRVMVNRQRSGPGTTGINCPARDTLGSDICNWGSEIEDKIDTFEGSGTITLVPRVLSLNVGALYSSTDSATNTYALGSALVTSDPQFPDVKNIFERFDVKLDYAVARTTARRLGWKGDLTLQLAYALERNHMSNWAIDQMQPYMVALDFAANRSLYLDAYNPNYTASIVSVRLGMKF